MTESRENLASAISKAKEWQEYCDRVDAQIAAKDAAYLKSAAEERREAQQALE